MGSTRLGSSPPHQGSARPSGPGSQSPVSGVSTTGCSASKCRATASRCPPASVTSGVSPASHYLTNPPRASLPPGGTAGRCCRYWTLAPWRPLGKSGCWTSNRELRLSPPAKQRVQLKTRRSSSLEMPCPHERHLQPGLFGAPNPPPRACTLLLQPPPTHRAAAPLAPNGRPPKPLIY